VGEALLAAEVSRERRSSAGIWRQQLLGARRRLLGVRDGGPHSPRRDSSTLWPPTEDLIWHGEDLSKLNAEGDSCDA
jgi:hypothetical protein